MKYVQYGSKQTKLSPLICKSLSLVRKILSFYNKNNKKTRKESCP